MNILAREINTEDRLMAHRCLRISFGASLIVIAIGLVVLVGWSIGSLPLMTVPPCFVRMKSNTAIAFCLAGASLFLFTRAQTGSNSRSQNFSTASAAIVALIGGLTLIEYVVGCNLGIDELLFRDPSRSASVHYPPGRPAPITALNFLCLGLALILIRFPKQIRWAHFLTGCAAFTSQLALVGYFYGVDSLYQPGNFTAVAFHTAIAFLALCVGVLCATSRFGIMKVVTGSGTRGMLVRRYGLAVLVLPFLFDWLELQGENRGWYGAAFGDAVSAMVTVAAFGALIWIGARSVRAAEGKEEQSRESLREAHLDLERLVTERTLELLHSNETLQMQAHVIESMSEAVIVADGVGRIVTTNPACDLMFGYGRGELIGMHVSVLRDLDEAEGRRASEETMAAAQGRSSWSEEINRRKKDGTPFITQAQISAFEMAGKRHFFAIQKDITERKQAEEALRESEERFSSAFHYAPIGVALVGLDGRWLKVNRAVCELMGYLEAELLASSFQNITHPDDLEGDLEYVRQLLAGESAFYQMEKRYLHKSGRVVTALLSVSLVREAGQPLYFISQLQDITERTQSEKQLEESRNMLQLVIEAIPVRVFWKDRNLKILGCNTLFARDAGFHHPREVSGLDDFDMSWKQQAETYRADDRRVIAEGVPRLNIVEPHTNLAGATIWVNTSKAPLHDANGEVVGVLGVYEDITERKEADAALEKANRQLQDASREAGMAEIATSVLHNVGNVLNSVNISAAVATDMIRRSRGADVSKIAALLQKSRDDLPKFLASAQGMKLPDFLMSLGRHLGDEQRKVLTELQSLCTHIDHIKEIVEMQQTYARRAGLSEQLSAESLVEDALRLNAAAFDHHGLNVVRDFEEAPLIEVDKHKALQILTNLVRNAKDAMNQSSAAGKQMTVRIRREGDALVHISVADQGVGIPAENLTRIFAHGFTTRKDGHGFGLHSAALAAKEMGGSLTAQSDGPGKGAVFTLLLPLTSKPNNPEAQKLCTLS